MNERKTFESAINTETFRNKTGKTWDEWFTILDKWWAKEQGHEQIARYLESGGVSNHR